MNKEQAIASTSKSLVNLLILENAEPTDRDMTNTNFNGYTEFTAKLTFKESTLTAYYYIDNDLMHNDLDDIEFTVEHYELTETY